MGKLNDGAWETGIGFIAMDDIEPSPEFLELVERKKRRNNGR